MKIIQKSNDICKWDKLAKIGQNPIINRTYIYLFLLPFVIRLLRNYNYESVIDSIPFSWHVLYFSAFSFTIGSLLYYIFCPSLIKDNKSFANFSLEKKGWQHLYSYLNDIRINSEIVANLNRLRKKDIANKDRKRIDLFNILLDEQSESINFGQDTYDSTGFNVIKRVNEIEKKNNEETRLKLAFENCFLYANSIRHLIRLTILILFFIGFLLIGSVVINSFALVLTTNIELFK